MELDERMLKRFYEYYSGDPKTGPFEIRTKVDHLKTGHVGFRIPTVLNNNKKYYMTLNPLKK